MTGEMGYTTRSAAVFSAPAALLTEHLSLETMRRMATTESTLPFETEPLQSRKGATITSIYVLVDPAAPDLARYVGYARNVSYRLKAHVKEALQGHLKTRKCNWIRKVVTGGRLPSIVIIDVADSQQAAASLERLYIALYRRLGADLTNSTVGGEGVFGLRFTPEQREKQSRSQLKRFTDPAQREKLAASRKDIWTPEKRAEHSKITRKFFADNPQARERLSEQLKTESPVVRKKRETARIAAISTATRSETTGARMSASQRRRQRNPEERDRQRLVAKKLWAERRDEMSAAIRRGHARSKRLRNQDVLPL